MSGDQNERTRTRARNFVAGLGWPELETRQAQRRYNLVYTDDFEQERTDRSQQNDGAGFGGSPGEGYTNGPQTIVNEPQTEPTETPELMRDPGSGESGVGPANITGAAEEQRPARIAATAALSAEEEQKLRSKLREILNTPENRFMYEVDRESEDGAGDSVDRMAYAEYYAKLPGPGTGAKRNALYYLYGLSPPPSGDDVTQSHEARHQNNLRWRAEVVAPWVEAAEAVLLDEARAWAAENEFTRQADPLPLSIQELDHAPREVPSELDEQVMLNEYARPDVNEFEDTDVITD